MTTIARMPCLAQFRAEGAKFDTVRLKRAIKIQDVTPVMM